MSIQLVELPCPHVMQIRVCHRSTAVNRTICRIKNSSGLYPHSLQQFKPDSIPETRQPESYYYAHNLIQKETWEGGTWLVITAFLKGSSLFSPLQMLKGICPWLSLGCYLSVCDLIGTATIHTGNSPKVIAYPLPTQTKKMLKKSVTNKKNLHLQMKGFNY